MSRDLTTRAQSAVANQNDQPTLKQLIERMKPEIARALPKQMDPDRIVRIAITVLNQTPKLAECTAESFLGALMTSSQLGLEPSGPGGLGEAYLVPYGGKVTFVPGYKGLIKLAWQSGQMRSIGSHVVYERDEFDFEYGSDENIRHRPFMDGDRGKPVAVWSDARFLTGGYKFVVLSISAIEAIRKRSRAANNGPWVTDWDAMARKSGLKQLIRWLPLSTELQGLARAAQLDETVRESTAGALDDAQVGWIAGETVNQETGEVIEEGVVVQDPPEEPEGWR
jgi:recombination protein RecT